MGPCNWTAGPKASGSGQLTCYWLGQGTPASAECASPGHKTFCGYCGTESGSNNGQFCPPGISDMVPNISATGTYFAAFPSGSFGAGTYCGMCVQISFGGKSIVATVVDACATCPESGHLDLSLSAAAALGLSGNTGTASGVTWQSVSCPTTSNIVAVYNAGSSAQPYFQNVVFPVAKAVVAGKSAVQQSGFWNFGMSTAGQQVTLTDTLGHTVTGTMPSSSGGSVGVQFPMVCQ
jgi:expansin (peptidoglycan-binding protein)